MRTPLARGLPVDIPDMMHGFFEILYHILQDLPRYTSKVRPSFKSLGRQTINQQMQWLKKKNLTLLTPGSGCAKCQHLAVVPYALQYCTICPITAPVASAVQ